MIRKLVTFCFLSLVSQNLMAEVEPQTPAASATQTHISASIKELKSEVAEKKFSLDVDLSGDSNFRSANDPAYQADSYISLAASYKINSLMAISGRVGIDQKLYADQRTDLSDTSVKISFSPFNLDRSRSSTLSLSGVLPSSEVNLLQNSFEGAVGVSVDFVQKYFTLGIRENGQIKIILSALKNFHQYDRTAEFVPNISYRFREAIDIEQDLTKKLSFEILAFYQNGYTYNNDLKTFFHIDETLNYQITKKIAIYGGHSNEANALQNNGIDSNISLYDGYTSIFKAGTTISF